MIKTIELGKHCYGEYIRINEKDIIDETYDDIVLNEKVYKQILELLEATKHELDSRNWNEIMEIIVSRSQSFELVKDDHDCCDQCGDWNYYKKLERITQKHK
jgi:hypothetical protein